MNTIERCPDCGRMKARNAEDATYGACDKWYAIRDPEAQQDCLETVQSTNTFKQLEAAKQRELELLAVIEFMRDGLDDYWVTNNPIPEPSQALREHEANVLEEAAGYFDRLYSIPEFERIKQAYVTSLRRMAGERRKK